MNDRLQTTLRQLRLSGLAQTLDVRLQEALGHQLSHAEFLELILQDELLVREERQIGRRVKSAAFRELKTLDQFDWSFNPSVPRKQVFDLATGRFIREAKDVLFLGPPGVGKPRPTQYTLCDRGLRRPRHRHRSHTSLVRSGIRAVWSGTPAGTCAALPGRGPAGPVRLYPRRQHEPLGGAPARAHGPDLEFAARSGCNLPGSVDCQEGQTCNRSTVEACGNGCPRPRNSPSWTPSLKSSWRRSNMNGSSKILPTHLNRQAVVYLRQSDPKQVRQNRESALNQRALQERLRELGWKKEQISVIDGDQGLSGKHSAGREGFQKLVADVGLGKMGIILGYEVSRLARNNADWPRLLELCALFDTLIGDSDGIYHPRDFVRPGPEKRERFGRQTLPTLFQAGCRQRVPRQQF